MANLGASDHSAKQLHLLDLPLETQHTVLGYVTHRDLANFCLASHSCRDLAAAHLYRTLGHVFQDDDVGPGKVSVDRLAGILETLVSSDYNYARHLKAVMVDVANLGDNGDKAYWEFTYESSCGKFLNTLLLTALKKVVVLETFCWNVRIELSPAIYRRLHSIKSLQHLHIRLQAGPSLHSSSKTPAAWHVIPTSTIHPPPPPVMGHAVPPPPVPSFHHTGMHNVMHPFPSSNVPPPRVIWKRFAVNKQTSTDGTFSGFSGLKSLSILDMDTLDYLEEIATCIVRSSDTLKCLKLSFSENLALKARKKLVVEDSETESNPDDEYLDLEDDDMPLHSPPAAQTPSFQNNSSSNAPEVRKERIAQDRALGRIFGLEKTTPADKKLEEMAEEAITWADYHAQASLRASSKVNCDKLFVKELQLIMRELRKKSNHGPATSSKSLKMMEKIEKAATKYLERSEGSETLYEKKRKSSASKMTPPPKPPAAGHNTALTLAGLQGELQDVLNKILYGSNNLSPGDPAPNFSGLNQAYKQFKAQLKTSKSIAKAEQGHLAGSSKTGKQGKNKFPPLMKYDHPAPILSTSPSTSSENQDGLGDEALQNAAFSQLNAEPSVSKGADPKLHEDYRDDVDMEHPDEFEEENEDQEFADAEAEAETEEREDIQQFKQETNHLDAAYLDSIPSSSKTAGNRSIDLEEFTDDRPPSPQQSPKNEDAMREYLRLNHGIPLEAFYLYLIPARPSVLCRAIDMSTLKHITLLNVGPQRAFWNMLTKMHETTPFALRSFHTDNVTPAFLEFLKSLDVVEELFMVERNSMTKVEPFAPKTLVDIGQIRDVVLKKHARHLKRLMIRNDDDSGWALDRKSVGLICKYGSKLRELAVTMSLSVYHIFVQHIYRLNSLHAFQLIYIGTDHCPALLREIRSNIIDRIGSYAHLKVEYIAVSHNSNGTSTPSPSRIIRKSQKEKNPSESKIRSKGKGKGKAPVRAWVSDNSSASDSSEETDIDFGGSRIETVDSLKLKDIEGVKIWDKAVWGQRL